MPMHNEWGLFSHVHTHRLYSRHWRLGDKAIANHTNTAAFYLNSSTAQLEENKYKLTTTIHLIFKTKTKNARKKAKNFIHKQISYIQEQESRFNVLHTDKVHATSLSQRDGQPQTSQSRCHRQNAQ